MKGGSNFTAESDNLMAAVSTHVAQPHKLFGRIIAPGTAFGYAHFEEPLPSTSSSNIEPDEVRSELSRLEASIGLVRRHLEEHVREYHSPAEEDYQQIISSHLLILEDRQFFSSIIRRIESECVSAERAVEEEFKSAADRLEASRDQILRARAEDLRDICQTIREAFILGDEAFQLIDLNKKEIIFISENLHPSAVLRARRLGAVAFVTSSTAYSSHGASHSS